MEETTTAITAVKQEIRRRDWATQIEAQQASSMTALKWCEENEINLKTYYYHLRKLREKCVSSAPTIVPLAVPKQNNGIHIEKNGLQISLRIYQNSNTVIHTNYVSYVQRVYQGTYNRCECSFPPCGQRGVCLL